MEGYNIIRQNAIPPRHSPYQKSITALQSRFTAWLFCIAGKEITMPRAPNQ